MENDTITDETAQCPECEMLVFLLSNGALAPHKSVTSLVGEHCPGSDKTPSGKPPERYTHW